MTPSNSDAARSSSEGTSGNQADPRLLEALRQGDEDAFTALIEQYQPALVRLATVFVGSRAVAEEVAQETWLAVLQGIDRFEGRSSVKTWIFSILGNRARTRGQRESRSVSFSALASSELTSDEPAVEPERFRPVDDQWAGGWVSFPRSWEDLPEDRLVSRETMSHVRAAIAGLPPSQREVMTLRDVEGWASDEVCNVLGISETNQRVLLHRARSKVRRALEVYFATQ